MITVNLNDDMTTLTTIPHSAFDKLNSKTQYIICHAIEEAQQCKDDTVEIVLGYGTLTIKIEEEAIKYRFTPSQSLNNNIKNTVLSNSSPLVSQVEATLKDRITNVYKDLF